MLEVKLLGQFEVKLGGKPAAIPSRPAQALFAYLILNANAAHRREQLAGLLWPDTSDENARSNLRHALWRIRKAIETKQTYLITDDLSIRFDPDSQYWLDARAIDRVAGIETTADDLIEALANYRGELLPGFYDEWITLERERLQAMFERKMEQLLDRLIAAQRWSETLEWGEKWIAFGQTPEPAYRAMMQAHAALGNMAKVAATFERCMQALRTDLGVEPSEQTRALYESVKSSKQMLKAALSVSSVKGSASNIPVPLTSFVGRELELKEIAKSLSASRLLTLTGSGGVGKTRLAIQVAAELVSTFEDGVGWVELASLTDASLVAQAVATVLGMPEILNQPLSETLAHDLRAKQLLLVLDNCEHLINACAQLVEYLLSQCPLLKIFATSREPLGIMGEYVFQVPTLSLPESQSAASPEILMKYEGVRLFVDRALSVKPDFILNAQNAVFVTRVCQQLDGIPLAIELAAARIKLLSVEEIARRLNDRFDLLTSGNRTALPRQRTLRATIDWSYDLLTEPEQILFRRLSVFAGGFTLKAAEEVCAIQAIDKTQVLELLAHLLDKSLVIAHQNQSGEETRYLLLKTIREYAHEKMIQANEEDAVCDSHLLFFKELAEEAESMWYGQQVTWFKKLDAEIDNFRAAIVWSMNDSDAKVTERVQSGLLTAGALALFFESRIRREAFELLKRILSNPKAKALTIAHAKALNAVGFLAWSLGNLDEAATMLNEALTTGRVLGDKLTSALALVYLGAVADFQGDYVTAQGFLEEGLALSTELDFAGKQIRGMGLGFLGDISFRYGDYPSAQKLYAEGIKLFRELQNKNMLTYSIRRMGYMALRQSDHATANSLFKECLQLNQELGHQLGMTACIAALAAALVAHGEIVYAAKLFGSVEASLNTLKASLFAIDQIEYESNLAAARAQLDDANFEAAWAEGLSMTLDQAIEFALANMKE